MTDLERQLVAECEKLIRMIRLLQEECGSAELSCAATAADEVEDFIVNNCEETV